MVTRQRHDAPVIAVLLCCILGAAAVAAGPSQPPTGLGIFVVPRFALAVAVAWIWVATTAVLGVVSGLVAAGLCGDLPPAVRWTPLAAALLIVLACPTVADWIVGVQRLQLPQAQGEYSIVSAIAVVAAAVLAARAAAGLDGARSAAIGLCAAWWLLGTNPPLPQVGVTGLYSVGTGLGGWSTELLLISLSLWGGFPLLERLARRFGAGDGVAVPPPHRCRGATVIAGAVLGAGALVSAALPVPRLIADHRVPAWSASHMWVAVAPAAGALLAVGVAAALILTVAAAPVDALVGRVPLPRLVLLTLAAAWFAGVAPHVVPPVSVPEFMVIGLDHVPPAAVTLGGLLPAGLLAYAVLRWVCRCPRRTAVLLATAFLIYVGVDSWWVLPGLSAAVAQAPRDRGQLFAHATLYAALAVAVAAVQVLALRLTRDGPVLSRDRR